MNRSIKNIGLFFLSFIGVMTIDVAAQELPTEQIVCEYPRLQTRLPFASLQPASLATATEMEPNNDLATAQVVPLGFASGQQSDVDVSGSISPFDQDWFEFNVNRGDTIGVAILAIDAASLDSVVSIRAANGNLLLQNDQHGGIGSYYPPMSPFPAGGTSGDAVLTFAFPTAGKYFVQVQGRGASTGGYIGQMRLREPPLRNSAAGTKQILFLDFDGASGIHADDMFGSGGIHNTTLSGLDSFLDGWSVPTNRRDILIDKIVANVTSHFNELLIGTQGEIEVRNSKDDPDTFGQPNVSRVIVGGKISELGIGTIGIAEFIDPANFSTNDTAVVLLDLLSAPATNRNSVLSLPRSPGLSLEDAVAHVVACVITHEACHFLGCWHTENGNPTASIIDRGGALPNLAGVGNDGILGTADDQAPIIQDDNFALEGIGRSQDIQNVRAMAIASLSVGTLTPLAETNAVNQLLAGLQQAEELSVGPAAVSLYTPRNTRIALGLPEMSPNEFQIEWQQPEKRLEIMKRNLESRLKGIKEK